MGTFDCKDTKWLLFSCVCVSLISVKAGVTSPAVKKHFAWFYMSGDDDTLALTENVVQ